MPRSMKHMRPVPRVLRHDKALVNQWHKCQRLFVTTNKEEEALAELLAPHHKKIADPDILREIGNALGDFSFMARFFFEKEYKQTHSSRGEWPTWVVRYWNLNPAINDCHGNSISWVGKARTEEEAVRKAKAANIGHRMWRFRLHSVKRKT
jgi:hypothetical protein